MQLRFVPFIGSRSVPDSLEWIRVGTVEPVVGSAANLSHFIDTSLLRCSRIPKYTGTPALMMSSPASEGPGA